MPNVSGKKSQTHPGFSDLVAVKEEEGMGRFAVAASQISPGSTVVVEKAYCAVLLAEHASTHCVHCFKR